MRAEETQEQRRAQEDREEKKAQEARSKEEGEIEAQEGHGGGQEMTTQEKCVEAKKEANSMHEESDVSNRHMTWWQTHGGSVWIADHACGRREGVDESGEQPEKQPNRLATMTGLKKPGVLPKRQRREMGKKRKKRRNDKTVQ